jgi:glycosyltransferase involved in cell wall biosynthesis
MSVSESSPTRTFGVVVIGRNEGERLGNCLASVIKFATHVVYVDSGSTDGSISLARGIGATVVELDMTVPFTAARARNEGAIRLLELAPDISFIQFVDGDCEVFDGWTAQAMRFLSERPDVAVLCGRRRERYPDRSIYNLMCDIEWNTPVGQAKSCGGDAMMRVDAFVASGGYRATLIAGEEPELCLRLRADGWLIWRIDADMVWHDAAIMKFSQWWKRAMRGGHAYAEGAYLHHRSPDRHGVRESLRIWIWGLAIPIIIVGSLLAFGIEGLCFTLIYPLQISRLWFNQRNSSPAPWLRSCFLVLAKFPEMFGQAKFIYSKLIGKNTKLMEYK